jgi:hypothetical protein
MASFKGYKRSIKLEFDYNEVKAGVPNVSKQMAILNAEFRKSSAEAEASGKEIDKLGTRYDYLSNKIKIQEQEVEKYRDRLEKATNAKGNNTKAIQNNTASLEIAEAKLAQTRAELDKVSKELDKQRTVLGKTSKEWGEMGDKLTSVGKTMSMTLTAPIMAAGAASFKLGADFEQALGKMNVVFERNSKNIEKWAQNSLRDFGLARSTAVTMASDFGALFKGMGISLTKTEEWSKTLTERAMDLSNFYDTTIEETTTALNAIVTGQTEPLRKFGINMTQAALQEYAFAQGIRKKVKDMTEAEKVQLRYNYVIEKTNIAVGTTARESDSATGQMNRFKEGIKELGISFSEQILPIITPVIEWLNDMIEKFSSLSDGTKKFIVIAGGIVAAIGPVLMILGSVFSAISKISSGISAIPKVIEGVSKAGKAFSGLLDNTAFLGFAKWALIIAAVAAAIATLVIAINYLIGKGREMNEFSRNMSEMVGSIGNSVQGARVRGYAVGTRYHPGGLAIVGEEGPELVNLPRGSQVYTTRETNDMLRGGDTYNLYVKMSEVDEVYKLVEVFKGMRQKDRAGMVMA